MTIKMKEAPSPPKSESEPKAVKTKKAAQKDVSSQPQEENLLTIHLPVAQDAAQIASEERRQEKQADH